MTQWVNLYNITVTDSLLNYKYQNNHERVGLNIWKQYFITLNLVSLVQRYYRDWFPPKGHMMNQRGHQMMNLYSCLGFFMFFSSLCFLCEIVNNYFSHLCFSYSLHGDENLKRLMNCFKCLKFAHLNSRKLNTLHISSIIYCEYQEGLSVEKRS